MSTPSKRFYTVRQIARATGVDKETVRRQARRENWPMKQRGNRAAYAVPGQLAAALKETAPGRCILDQPEKIRALDRACAVRGFVQEMQRGHGVENSLARTVSNFRHLKDFSVRILRRWIGSVERGGLGALHEHKLGRVGRRATALHKILK